MIRQKLTLGDYTYVIDYFFANEDLIESPHKETFYMLRNYSVLSDVIIDKDIYLINKEVFKRGNVIFPIPHNTGVGYSISALDYNSDLINLNINDPNIFHFYDKDCNEIPILCDKVRIYFPIINNDIDAIFDLENFVNDIKFHYYVDDIKNCKRYADNEFTEDHNTYSEYIELYVPSINELLYNNDIYIKDYNFNTICVDENSVADNEVIINNDNQLIPFNTLYYPFRVLEFNDENGIKNKKSFLYTHKYVNNQFYSTFNILIYPYVDINNENKFIIDNTYSSVAFNIDLSFNLECEIRFPYLDEIVDNEKYYGVPCLISKFNYKNNDGLSLEETYLKYNGCKIEDYVSFVYSDYEENFELFDESVADIKRTGFYIEISTDKLFKTSFFKYIININDNEPIIDDLIFPLQEIFSSWNDVPTLLVARVTYIDKVASVKITSNPIIISNEWYKYLVDGSYKHKLKLNNIYKNNMKIENKENLLFIDKINCNIIKSSEGDGQYNVYKSNTPKIIYKPIFYRTTDLNNITIKANVKQNVGINLGEYMSKVETFKLTIEDTEYIEYGRNDIFVIFNINSKNIKTTSGKYIITNETDDFISDGNWSIS